MKNGNCYALTIKVGMRFFLKAHYYASKPSFSKGKTAAAESLQFCGRRTTS